MFQSKKVGSLTLMKLMQFQSKKKNLFWQISPAATGADGASVWMQMFFQNLNSLPGRKKMLCCLKWIFPGESRFHKRTWNKMLHCNRHFRSGDIQRFMYLTWIKIQPPANI